MFNNLTSFLYSENEYTLNASMVSMNCTLFLHPKCTSVHLGGLYFEFLYIMYISYSIVSWFSPVSCSCSFLVTRSWHCSRVESPCVIPSSSSYALTVTASSWCLRSVGFYVNHTTHIPVLVLLDSLVVS